MRRDTARPTAAVDRALRSISTASVDVAADGRDDPARGRARRGAAASPASSACSPSSGARRSAPISRSPRRVPVGGGLSSSAAFEVAVALGAQRRRRLRRSPPTRPRARRAARRARRDRRAVRHPGPARRRSSDAPVTRCLIDCRTLEIEPLPLPAELRVLVVHSGVPRTLEGNAVRAAASGEHRGRRPGSACARCATRRFEQVRDEPRGRHAVTEMARVRAFADALRDGDIDALGPLMLASHASSRDDMEVSTPELDTLVECLVDAGALGARLTGAGFGGCVVALVPAARADAIEAAATAAYRKRTELDPTAWIVHAAQGAGPA